MSETVSDIRPGRLSQEQYATAFSEPHPPLNKVQALIESERCYYCFDAPCQKACPTSIDIPSFIQRIAQGNVRGAADAILQANPLGGMCARVCPTEVLCEQACVRNTNESKPVEIGLLQRYATDEFFAHPNPPLFERAKPTGKRVAVVGAGPAGLACAFELAKMGESVVLFEGRAKLGGLNEYGLATYKTVNGFAQKEIDWLLSIGGIEPRCNQVMGRDFTLASLLASYDAVFLGLGLAGVNALGIQEPQAQGLANAVDFIANLRQAGDYSQVPIGRRVVVVGGGMTAVDAAVQSKKLGAQEVTIVYRRGKEQMSASTDEQEWAKSCGVVIRHWAAPKELICEGGHVQAIRFQQTQLKEGKLTETSESFTLQADMVFKAIGQSFMAPALDSQITLRDGRIETDAAGRTQHARVWAGGDCRAGGQDLTVEAVEHGKRAAKSIHQTLSQ